MKMFAAVSLLALAVSPAFAGEPDNLVLPRGFHATVVAEGVGQARHLAIRGNDIYVSTNTARDAEPVGIIALRLGSDHKVVETQHFSTVANGTSIRFYKNALYATSPTTVYRFDFKGQELVPSSPAQVVIDGLPSKGYPSRGMAFDGKGGLYIEAGATGNICPDPAAPKGGKPVGLRPCPALNGRSGVWRFDAAKLDQKFPDGGEQIATGVRDMMAVDWSPRLNGLYGVMQGRNDRNDVVAEELHRIDKGADLGWPYTYYDMAQKLRLTAPEYGGDGKTPAEGNYTAPLAGLSAHQSPLDLVFYDAKQFPKEYRGGAFVVYHGGAGAEAADGHRGYDVEFVPFDKAGKPGTIQRFAEGFAGPNPGDRNPSKAAFRPTGAAVGPDGSLYVVDGKKGRIWRIAYDGKN
ncbi:MAG: PQQ-dependent sugar dehydrogenase [Alphaproteobacteria bacterium]|nr:PQQ-dependent sugar dehydrogenase [Alphaproteobacteria bacterium]